MIGKWIWREIRSQPAVAFSLFFTLFLGLLAFNGIDIIRFSVAQSLQGQSKILLAADLAVTARRELTAEERVVLKGLMSADDQIHEVRELYTMVKGDKNSRLVQLKAIPSDFAFYGKLDFANNIPGDVVDLNKSDKVWVHPELLTQLNLAIGDKIKIGDVNFEISNLISGDFVNSWKGLTLAPKIYIGLDRLNRTGLIKPGSTVSYNYLVKLSDPTLTKVKFNKLNEMLKDPVIRVYDDEKASKEIVRGLSAISDYLGLVAIVALFLAGIGVYFLFNGYILRKRSEIAIYNSLGLTRDQTVLIYCGYLVTIGTLALIPTWIVSYFILPAVSELIKTFMPFVVIPYAPYSVLVVSFLVTMLAVGVSSFSALLRIRNEPSANLFREDRGLPLSSVWGRVLGIIFAAVLIWILAVYQSHSLRVSSFFLVGLGGLLVALTTVGIGFINLLGRIANKFSIVPRLAVKSLSRQPTFSLFGIVAIGSSFFLTLLIPIIRDGLTHDLSQPPGVVLPNLFLFDIQDEQAAELNSLLRAKNFELENLSPVVRARVMEVNNQPFEKGQTPTLTSTREEDTEARFRSRGVNLSFRESLSDAEAIVEGKFYSEKFNERNEWAEISVEKFFMDQLHLRLGDKIVFDVQGVPVKGVVTSVRSVRWNTFSPNFFILIQPGVLEDAPKTFLGIIKGLSEIEVVAVQNIIVEKFPNISVVDVRRTVAQINIIIGTMMKILEIMSYLCLVIGFVIFIAVLYHHGESLVREWNLFSLLGMASSKVRQGYIMRMVLLGSVAGLVASLAAVVVSRIMLKWVFEVYAFPAEANYIFSGMLILSSAIVVISYLVYQLLAFRKS
ncbi:MAG: hypothetical protein A4S09_03065 [Proteobacteria bacterium SG_bin7]|nr:MAG: hypothetical protein A4S09_03065 [Proteobacteria bacterium SG_bin7]